MVTSLGVGAAVGTQAFSAGIVVGAATYQSVYGFSGSSSGGDAQFGQRLAVGGGYSTNSSGLLPSAFVGFGIGGRVTGETSLSVGTEVAEVCPG